MNKTNVIRILACTTLLSCATQLQAHHAGIAYDHGNSVTVTGTVKELQWTNPHTWIIVMVPDGKGGEEKWDLEGTSINTLIRAGWTIKTVQPGMKVKLLVSPRKDGTPGGEFNKLISINDVPFTPPVDQK